MRLGRLLLAGRRAAAVSVAATALLLLSGLTTAPLLAQDASGSSYRSGRFLIELRGKLGLDFGGEIYQNFKDQNRTLPVGPTTALSGDATAIALSYLSRQSAPEAELESIGGALGVEYAIWDWLGIGLDLGHTSLSLKDVRVIDNGTELGFVPIALLTGQRNISGELLFPFLTQELRDYDRISRADLRLAIHPLGFGAGPTGAVDPYLSLIGGYGRTKENRFDAVRYGAAFGLRYFVADWFYVVGEIAWVNNEISGEVDTSTGIFSSSSEFSGNLRETSAQLGFGFSL